MEFDFFIRFFFIKIIRTIVTIRCIATPASVPVIRDLVTVYKIFIEKIYTSMLIFEPHYINGFLNLTFSRFSSKNKYSFLLFKFIKVESDSELHT